MQIDLARRRSMSALLCSPFAWRGARAQGQRSLRFAFVSHAPTSEKWWNSVKNALLHAAEDFGVAVDYLNPADGSITEMVSLIRSLSPHTYAGVISTIADYKALHDPLSDLVRSKHLPLITVNSGTQSESERVGALLHIGQPEYEAGSGAGERARKDGIRSFLCVNNYATNPISFERCRGFGDKINADYRTSTLDAGDEPGIVEQRVAAYLRQAPQTEAVLTLGPSVVGPTLRGIEKAGLKGKVYMVTFDLSAEITRGVRDGAIRFAIDQQPYLQGYLPLALLAEYVRAPAGTSMRLIKFKVFANETLHRRMARYGLELRPSPGQHINSGPGFVTPLNLEKVERYAGQFR